MSKIQENKILANLIKADLKDALENGSRWKVSGLQHFFHEYWVWWDKEIWVCSEKNEELKKALAENRIRNQAKREATKEKETKKIEKETGKTWVDHWDKERKEMRENMSVMSDEINPSDWEEIKSLIAQIQPLKEKKDCERERKVNEKLNSKKGLVYWSGHGRRMSGTDDYGREWYDFGAMENGKKYSLSIPKNHSGLDNFSFDQEGFYLVEGFADNSTIRTNGYWTSKEVNLTNKITIVPYNDEETVNFAFKNNADENKRFEEDKRKTSSSGNKNLTVTGGNHLVTKAEREKDSRKIQENSELEQIKKYFLENNIKEITFKAGKLEVIYNDKKTSSSELTTNNLELWQLVKYCQEHNRESLSRKDLEIISNVNNSAQNANDNSKMNSLWIGGSILIGAVVVLGVFIFRSQVKRSKK